MTVAVTLTRDAVTPSLRAKLAKARNPRAALEAMGTVVVSMTQRAFTQPSLRPSTWPPLKAATIKAKQKKGSGSKPLIASGTLAQSPRIVSIDSKTVTVGSDRRAGPHSLAAIHQLGSKDGRIPARPVWPFNKQGRPTPRAQKLALDAAKRALDAYLA